MMETAIRDRGSGRWGMEEQIFEGFEKNSREQVIGLIQPFRGRWLSHIRIAVPSRDGDEWIPTRKGVAIDVDRFKELKDAILELGTVASRNRVVAEIDQTRRTQIRVGVNEYHGDVLCYVRTFYTNGDGGDWQPGKGISVRVEQLADLEELAQEIATAIDQG